MIRGHSMTTPTPSPRQRRLANASGVHSPPRGQHARYSRKRPNPAAKPNMVMKDLTQASGQNQHAIGQKMNDLVALFRRAPCRSTGAREPTINKKDVGRPKELVY